MEVGCGWGDVGGCDVRYYQYMAEGEMPGNFIATCFKELSHRINTKEQTRMDI